MLSTYMRLLNFVGKMQIQAVFSNCHCSLKEDNKTKTKHKEFVQMEMTPECPVCQNIVKETYLILLYVPEPSL